MKHARVVVVAAVVVIGGCHASPRPSLSAEERVRAALAGWGEALARDDGTLASAIDGEGQFALVYGGIKLAASHVDGGAEAVERSAIGLVLYALLPGWFAGPGDTWLARVPAGSLGPALVAAGLAAPPAQPGAQAFAFVPVPAGATIGKLLELELAHRAELRAKQAWTCRLARIEAHVAPGAPIFQRAARVSTQTFKPWIDGTEALWLVRATCASGPALFAITARKDGSDRVLLAKLL